MPEPAAIMVPIASLVPWAANPRHNDGAPVEAVADSIRRFGFGSPVLARRETGEIIAGHTRVKAARALGMVEVPVRYMDLDENEAHALALADNRVSEIATWDDEGLASVLTELRDAGTEIGGLGWDEAGLDSLMGRGVGDADGDPFANLPTDNPEFRSMTFTVSHDQFADIEAALKAATAAGPFVETGNDNRNGNALARVCEAYRGRS